MTEETVGSGGFGEKSAQKLTELTAPLSEAAETAARAARGNVGLSVLGGAAVGVVIGAMLTFGRGRKRPRKAARALASLTATVAELSQTLAAQASERAEAAAKDAQEKLSSASDTIGASFHDTSERLTKKGRKLADATADQLNDSGKALARGLIDLVEKLRR